MTTPSGQTKDLYATLGVERTATRDEIRSAFRRATRKWHPDVNPGDPRAEEQFKAIAGAHEVLADADKRARYDEFGLDGLREGFDPAKARSYQQWAQQRDTVSPGGVGGTEVPFEFDLGDLLRGGARGRPRRPSASRGADLRAVVELDFLTALRGSQIDLRVPGHQACARCHQSGQEPGTTASPCPQCDGTGRRPVVQGPMRIVGVCNTCGGTGTQVTPCSACAGQGVVPTHRDVHVRIPPGAEDGSELRVRGGGEPGTGAPAGDLWVQTKVAPHPLLRRRGLDLSMTVPVTLAEAMLGAAIDVPTLEGEVTVKVPPHAQSGTKLRLRGKGVQRGKERGDLFVELAVRLPDREDADFTEALKKSAALYDAPVREEIKL